MNAAGPQVVGSLLYGADDQVALFVASGIPHMEGRLFGDRDPVTGRLPYVAIGVTRNSELVGGVVFHNFRLNRDRAIDIEMSAAFNPSTWCMPSTLRALFHYPFVTAKCIRMTTITGRNNRVARTIDEALGFRQEGVIRRAIDGKEDAIVYGMLRDECRWLSNDAEMRSGAMARLRTVLQRRKSARKRHGPHSQSQPAADMRAL